MLAFLAIVLLIFLVYKMYKEGIDTKEKRNNLYIVLALILLNLIMIIV